jgi:hypothetical protein
LTGGPPNGVRSTGQPHDAFGHENDSHHREDDPHECLTVRHQPGSPSLIDGGSDPCLLDV